MKKYTVMVFVILALVVSTDAQALNKVRAYTALTGGGTGALDKTPIAELTNGDIGLVVTATNFYFYSFVAASTAAESSPWYVRPDDYTGSGLCAGPSDCGVWVAVNIGAPAIDTSPQDDGYVQFDPSTASESDWWFGPNHDSEGDDDDPVELRQSATAGTNVRFRVNKDGSLTLYGTINLANGETIANSTDTQIAFASNGNEDVILDLDTTTDNEVTWSSSTGVTQMSFSAMNLVTTGTISGAIPSTTDNNGQTLTAALQYGYMHWATGAGTTNLVTAVAGMNFCVYSTTAAAVVINPADADVIYLNGAALSAGDSITSASAAGDFICLVSHEAGKWVTMGRSGTWTDTN